MQLKWLEDLLALQEAGSIVRAAQRRHVTHPAFGRRLRALEAWAGAALIVREAPTLQFTAAGEAMLDAAREAITALARVRQAGHREAEQESVHVVTGRTLARTLLPTWYARMQPIFGERKLHSLEEGLTAMAAWVREHGARQSKRFEGIEVEKNFPKAWLS